MDKWKDKLKNLIPSDLEEEISIFETQIELMRRGEIDDRIFAETRLRRGDMDNAMIMDNDMMGIVSEN